jgi:hypothetical protein
MRLHHYAYTLKPKRYNVRPTTYACLFTEMPVLEMVVVEYI